MPKATVKVYWSNHQNVLNVQHARELTAGIMHQVPINIVCPDGKIGNEQSMQEKGLNHLPDKQFIGSYYWNTLSFVPVLPE